MSHEIRTPLNSVINFAELLSKEIVDLKQLKQIKAIQTGGKNLLTLLNDILDLSKLEVGRMDVQIEPTRIRELIGETTILFDYLVESKKIELISEFATDLPPSLLIDCSHLRQVVLNLIGNAVKFTEFGRVTVSLSYKDASQLVISIADTGIGIPEDQQEQIFEQFRQQNGQSHRTYGGTGLGLSISRRLVELMNGTIAVSSVVGKGSTFTVTVPAEVDNLYVPPIQSTVVVHLNSAEPLQRHTTSCTSVSLEDQHRLSSYLYQLERAISPLQFSDLEEIAARLIEEFMIVEVENFAQQLSDAAGTMDIDFLLKSPHEFSRLLFRLKQSNDTSTYLNSQIGGDSHA